MRVIVNDKMKEWVAAYIRNHRKGTCISIHVVFSNFNEDFKRTFNIDPRAAIQLLIAEGFIKGSQARGGFSIWLPEDTGKGQRRPFRSRQKAEKATVEEVVQKVEQPVVTTAQAGEVKMKMIEETVVPAHSFEFLHHPETGETDILKLLGYVTQKLGTMFPAKPKVDGGYRVGKLRLFYSLVEVGIPREKCADISRILQEMAFVRKYPKSEWGVIHHSAIVYFLTPSLYNIAKQAMTWRDERNNEISTLRQKLATLTGASVDVSQSVPVLLSPSTGAVDSFEDEAIEALAEAERLSDELANLGDENTKMKARLVEVEGERDHLAQQLSERPQQAELVKQAFHERLSALKAVRG